MRNFVYFFKEALIGFKRNFSTAFGSIITIFLSLLIIGIFLIGGTVVENVVTSVENEVTITAYVADDASEADIASVEQSIKNMEHVANVTFTTKEQALENFRNSMTSNPEIINQLDGQNPLPASINVELSDPQQVEKVANMILANSTFKKICDNPTDPSDSLKYGQKTVDRLFKLINYVRYIGLALIILLIVTISVLSAVLSEFLFEFVFHRRITIGDCSAALTGLIFALMLPVSVPWWIPASGAFLAIILVKQVFGGIGKNIFNPALFSRCVMMLVFPGIMSTFTVEKTNKSKTSKPWAKLHILFQN